jgi:hypothetical protein
MTAGMMVQKAIKKRDGLEGRDIGGAYGTDGRNHHVPLAAIYMPLIYRGHAFPLENIFDQP